MITKFVTDSGIDYYDAFRQRERFVLLNMGPGGGIWLVDKEFPDWEQCRVTALGVAQTYGTQADVEKIEAQKKSNP